MSLSWTELRFFGWHLRSFWVRCSSISCLRMTSLLDDMASSVFVDMTSRTFDRRPGRIPLGHLSHTSGRHDAPPTTNDPHTQTQTMYTQNQWGSGLETESSDYFIPFMLFFLLLGVVHHKCLQSQVYMSFLIEPNITR